MAIVLRSVKGSALTFAELDGNFVDLDGRVTANTSALVPAALVTAINTALGGTTWQSGGSGTATFASIAGVPGDNAALAAALALKADLLAPVTEVAAFSITKAGHTNREVTYINAAGGAATFNFTDMVAGDGGVIVQGGAGVATLTSGSGAGAPFVYAPGVTASPTTAGQHGSIGWTLIDATAGNQVVRIDYRSQVAGAGAAEAVNKFDATITTIPDDTVENVIYPINLGVLPVGTHVRGVIFYGQAAGGAAGGVQITLRQTNAAGALIDYDGTDAQTIELNGSCIVEFVVVSNTALRTVAGADPGASAGGPAADVAVTTIAAGCTLAVTALKSAGAVGRVVSLRGAYFQCSLPT